LKYILSIKENKRKSKTKKEKYIFDELFYKWRLVIERTNTWSDAFKVLVFHFEIKNKTWKELWLLAFPVILPGKI
jgi:hypothetical protein